MKKITATLLLLCLCAYMQAQVSELSETSKQIIEETIMQAEDENEAEALYENFTEYLNHPLDINNATASELAQFPYFSAFQVQSLLDYRKVYGALFSIHELAFIHGFNTQMAEQLNPFLIVLPFDPNKKESFWQRFSKGKHQLVFRTKRTLEQRKGYEEVEEETEANKQYLGFPWSLYLRYRYTYRKNLQWGITATNGAGEPFFKHINPYGFDFYSAHIMVNDVSKNVRQLLIGDYQALFGQGLVVWSGAAARKSVNVLAAKKQERGFVPHTGSDENRFLRGIAVGFTFNKLAVSAFCSYKFIDASTDSSGFKTLQTSGIHNTEKTAADKHSLSEFVSGYNISFTWGKVKIGSSGLWHRYGAENYRDIRPYNRFELSKNHNFNTGIDFSALWKQCNFFGELGLSANGGKAGLVGLLLDLSYSFRFSTLYRYYAKDYQALYAKGFGENSKTANEEGWYIGLQWVPHRLLTINASSDIYSFPWFRYGINAPSNGWDYRLQIAWQTTPETLMSFSFQHNSKALSVEIEQSGIKQVINNETIGVKYNIRYELIPQLRMEDRIQLSFIKGSTAETGLLLYHDINYKLPFFSLSCSARLAVFDTESWSSRLYAYENDVLGAFSVPAYYAQGSRWYANLHWAPQKNLDIWLRLAQTRYTDKETISSGLASIVGNVQTDFTLQVRWRF
ncbi:MAG: helix-hairpin-helix domain-containing protein [Bacteroidales bacterium]|nr:helix-hairpin-helix domain-containing protein [Bacteroidales bacterium]MCL2132915.1 helix-hairpin-helix domain-containing protein [Bacteroidales bacterium]